jgi:hypothetical protein
VVNTNNISQQNISQWLTPTIFHNKILLEQLLDDDEVPTAGGQLLGLEQHLGEQGGKEVDWSSPCWILS